MRRLLPLLLLPAALAASCTKSEPSKPASTPTSAPVATVAAAPAVPAAWADVADQLPPSWVGSLAFAQTMVKDHGAVIDQVTCHCCNKSLGECFRGTIGRQPNSCPPL